MLLPGIIRNVCGKLVLIFYHYIKVIQTSLINEVNKPKKGETIGA